MGGGVLHRPPTSSSSPSLLFISLGIRNLLTLLLLVIVFATLTVTVTAQSSVDQAQSSGQSQNGSGQSQTGTGNIAINAQQSNQLANGAAGNTASGLVCVKLIENNLFTKVEI
jgi:hypothetical protein